MDNWLRTFGGDDEEIFAPGDLTGDLVVGGGDLIEHRGPVGTGVRPGQLYAPLRLPFGR